MKQYYIELEKFGENVKPSGNFSYARFLQFEDNHLEINNSKLAGFSFAISAVITLVLSFFSDPIACLLCMTISFTLFFFGIKNWIDKSNIQNWLELSELYDDHSFYLYASAVGHKDMYSFITNQKPELSNALTALYIMNNSNDPEIHEAVFSAFIFGRCYGFNHEATESLTGSDLALFSGNTVYNNRNNRNHKRERIEPRIGIF